MATPIDPQNLYRNLIDQVKASRLNGFVPKDGARFGITTGAPEEWARLLTMTARQESGLRQAPRNPDGSVARFATTPRGERSYGPYQFNIGEYGLRSWDDVNDPYKSGGAAIRVAERFTLPSGYLSDPNGNRGFDAYFGSFRRPNEILQHTKWADSIGLGKPIGPPNVAMNAGATGMSPTGTAGISGSIHSATPSPPSPLFKDTAPAPTPTPAPTMVAGAPTGDASGAFSMPGTNTMGNIGQAAGGFASAMGQQQNAAAQASQQAAADADKEYQAYLANWLQKIRRA